MLSRQAEQTSSQEMYSLHARQKLTQSEVSVYGADGF